MSNRRDRVPSGDPDGSPAKSISLDSLVRPGEFFRESLQHLIPLMEAGGWRLVGWERYGQPAIDRVLGTFEGPADQGGKIVEGMLQMPAARPRIRDVFPKGIPVIDRVTVVLEAVPEAR